MEEKALEIKKHVGIIHCSNCLTLLQRKLSNALLYHAYNDLLTQEKHEIRIGDLSRLIGYASHDYDTIKKAIKALMATVLEWNLLKDDLSNFDNKKLEHIKPKRKTGKGQGGAIYSWHASSILASACIDGAVCTYSYSPELKALLYMPEIYGKINLLIQARFTSAYALALYENCVRYKNLNHTGWIPFITFRKLMGIPHNKYQKFKDFKRRVLDKAIEEVNKLSDIYVQTELQRAQRQVIAIKFTFNKNKAFCEDNNCALKQARLEDNKTVKENINPELKEILQKEFQLSSFQITKLLKSYSTDYIFNKIELVKASPSFQNKKISNLAAYFLTAVKDDFQKPITLEKKSLTLTEEQQNKMLKEKEKEMNLQRRKEIAYQNHITETIGQALAKIPVNKSEEIRAAFHKAMLYSPLKFIKEQYQKLGNQAPIIQAYYNNFVIENYSDLVAVMSFEDFINKQS